MRLTLIPSDAQRRAIEAPLGPVLVVAGPGAGKTFCLIARIGHLIAREGIAPGRICAVTFTNKAADEIAGRLRREIGPDAEDITRGTLHALCFRAAPGLRQLPPASGGASASPTTTTSGGSCAACGCARSARASSCCCSAATGFSTPPLAAPATASCSRPTPRRSICRNLLDYDDLIARNVALLRARPEALATCAAAGTSCWWTNSRT